MITHHRLKKMDSTKDNKFEFLMTLSTLHFQKCLQNCIAFEFKANWILLCYNLLFLVSRIHSFSLQRFSFEANQAEIFWTCQTSQVYELPFKKV